MSNAERVNTVAFVGLGMMGGPMAENLLKKGHPLVVFDIDQAKVRQFVERGARAATGPADAARQLSARVLGTAAILDDRQRRWRRPR